MSPTRKDASVLGAAIIFGMIWTQIHARRITAGQISVTDVARPRFRVPLGLLFALAVLRYTFIDRLVAWCTWCTNAYILRLLPDISNFDNFSAGVITVPWNANDDRKTIRCDAAFLCLMHRSYRARLYYLLAICFVNCHCVRDIVEGNGIVLAQGFSKWSANSLFPILDPMGGVPLQILGVKSCGIRKYNYFYRKCNYRNNGN